MMTADPMQYPVFGTDADVYTWILDASCVDCGAERGEECSPDCPTAWPVEQ